MKRNSRLSLALHALGHMAAVPDRPCLSADIADHCETNAVVVRRVLGALREAGLVTSEKGHAGGWRLARPAPEITLGDVYKALGESILRADRESGQNPPQCRIEATLLNCVDDALDEAERALVDRLRQVTIADLIDR